MYNTKLLQNSTENIEFVSKLLNNSEVVAIPTETVYGLAANALDACAVEKIFKVKNRPNDNPLIVHVSNIEDIYNLVESFPQDAIKLAQAFWPGALTLIFKKSAIVPYEITAGLETVAVRLPSHPVARALLKAANIPLAAPSANLSGKPSPTTAQHVLHDLNGKIPAILDGGSCQIGLESTVLSLVDTPYQLLRPGIITQNQIEAVVGPIHIDHSIISGVHNNATPKSPGMKYKHYAPKANILLIKSSSENFIEFINSYDLGNNINAICLCYTHELDKININKICIGKEHDYSAQAQNLFSCLRNIDSMENVNLVLAHLPCTDNESLAIYNRIIRAANFNVIEI